MKTTRLTSSLGRGRRPRLNRMWNLAGPRHFHVLVDVASCLPNLPITDNLDLKTADSRCFWLGDVIPICHPLHESNKPGTKTPTLG